MRYSRRQQKYLALADGYIGYAPVLHRFEQHVPLHLEEKLLARVMMKIFAGIGAAHGHDDEGAVLKQQFVAHRRFEQIAGLVDPSLAVEGGGYEPLPLIAAPWKLA